MDCFNSKQEALRLSQDTKDPKEESRMFYLEHIKNELITLASETLSSGNNFETKLQAKFATSDQSFDKV